MEKLLVIGAGFLGAEIYKQLNSDYEIILTTRSGRDSTIKLDVLSDDSYQAVPEEIAHVVYCVSADGPTKDQYEKAYSLGLAKALQFFSQQEIQSFTFISSTGVYSENKGAWVEEDGERLELGAGPSSFIVEGEDVLLKTQGEFIKRVCRLSGIYGPGRDYLVRMALGLEGEEYDEEPCITNRVHKGDAARAIGLLIGGGLDGVWNISDTCPSEKLQVLNFIRKLHGLKELIGGRIYQEKIKANCYKGKRISNQKLLAQGFKFLLPSYKEGYGEANI